LDSGESNIPLYLFPQKYHFHEFTLKFQAHYFPSQGSIVSSFGETLFTITPKTIDQIMQIPRADSLSPLSIEILTEMYQKLSFPQRAQIFELFLPENSQLPKMNPPYHSSIFSVKGNHIISSLCCILGYYSNEWVDEPILGFYPYFPPKIRLLPSSTTTIFWPTTSTNNSSSFLQRACSGILQYWHTCSSFSNQRSSPSPCRS
jgi:hypothetical protein